MFRERLVAAPHHDDRAWRRAHSMQDRYVRWFQLFVEPEPVRRSARRCTQRAPSSFDARQREAGPTDDGRARKGPARLCLRQRRRRSRSVWFRDGVPSPARYDGRTDATPPSVARPHTGDIRSLPVARSASCYQLHRSGERAVPRNKRSPSVRRRRHATTGCGGTNRSGMFRPSSLTAQPSFRGAPTFEQRNGNYLRNRLAHVRGHGTVPPCDQRLRGGSPKDSLVGASPRTSPC